MGFASESALFNSYEYVPSQGQLSLVLLQIHKYEGSRFIDALSHLRNFGDCDIEQKSELASWMASFADFLTDKFLLPRKMISLRGKSDADHL